MAFSAPQKHPDPKTILSMCEVDWFVSDEIPKDKSINKMAMLFMKFLESKIIGT